MGNDNETTTSRYALVISRTKPDFATKPLEIAKITMKGGKGSLREKMGDQKTRKMKITN